MLLASLALAVTAVLGVGAAPASAHDQLLASTPAADTALATAPTEVSLQFSDSVLTIGAIVLLVDQDERDWIGGDPVLDGSTVTASVDGELPAGAYEVRWRVVSADGHPISGLIPFTVGDAAPAARPTAPAVATPEPSATPEAGSSAPESSGGDMFRPLLIGVGGAVVAVLLFWAITAWRRRRPGTTSETESP